MGKKFKKLLAAALSLIMLFSFCTVPMTASAEDTNLKFGSDGKFKIVIFSDVQDQYPVHQRVIRIMEQAIEREKPDLVVFNGDNTEINTKDPEVDYRRTVEQILAPVVEAGIPYALVFGNHDPQSYYQGQVTSKDAMLAVWQSVGDCRTTDPAPELTGTGTCSIPIYSSNGNDVAFNLWMVDSGSYQDPLDTSSGFDNPHADQLAWMKANNNTSVNSLVFQHIPMPETYNLFVEDENGEHTYGGKKYALELKEGVTGFATEFPSTIYADDSAGEFQTLKEMGNVLGVFNGHDHLNDFSGTYDGITMTNVPGMTYFNYGDEAIRGYGVIELDESDLSTYNYNTVKFSTLDAEAGLSTEVTYDAYDEITYADLKENGNALGSEYTISGGHTFTYDATSPSKSAIFKYRWTAGSKPGFQFSFDLGADGNISHPFGVWIKRADQVEPNGAWELKPNKSELSVPMTAKIQAGETYDIEFGRLKVLTGEPRYVGMYYVYLKVNGKLIQEGYSNTDENGGYVSGGADCQVSNVIRFGGWGNGGEDKISQYVEPVVEEEYAAYDVIGYEDLLDTGNNPLTPGGIQLTKTDNSVSYIESAEAAKTHSVIFKLRWTMETKDYFQIHFGSWGGHNNFAYIFDGASWRDRATGETVAVNPRAVVGDYYDFEVARLMVTSGKNAGKYYTYFKVDGEIIFEKYVAADDENTTKYLGNKIYLGFENNNTCKISATPYDPDPDSLYYAYDEVTYYDFLKDGKPLSGDVYQIGGNSTFTYDKTSDTGSAIVKFRWKEANAGSSFQLSFDREGSVAYMFGMQLYTPDEQFPNGYIWLRPGYKEATKVELPEALEMGKDYDIEFARLKVKNGEHKGDWYVYFKINDVLVAEDYVDGSLISKQGNYTTNPGSYAATVSNIIYLTFWGNGAGNKIAPSPYEETYDAYDEIGFEDLFIGDISMNGRVMADGNHTYTYNATSPSYSTKFNFRWTAGETEPGFTLYFDDWKFPFCFCAKYPNRSDFGAAAGENGAWHLVPSNGSHIVQMDEPAETGDTYDIEIGRLKVMNGANKGKYYVYAKVDGELIKDYYYDGVVDGVYDGTALSNKIIIASTAGNAFSSIPENEEPEVPEEPVDPNPDSLYYDYDEITYHDLIADGSALSGTEYPINTKAFTYNKTSETGSAIVKYRWKAANAGSEFQLGFDTNDSFAYMFGVQLYKPSTEYPNGRIWLRPGYGPSVELPEPLVNGEDYDIEFARLKVKNGENAGKYYMYFKLNGELLAEDYVDADVVDANGNYTSSPSNKACTISNNIYLTFWGNGGGNKISAIPVPETYEDYDEITFDDLYEGSTSMSGKEMDGSHNYTYNATSASYSMILKYRWVAGGSEMKFTTFLDDWVYPFCFAAKTPNQAGFGATAGPNGSWHLVPSNDIHIVDMDEPIVAGKAYDIEIARLKVKTGANAGKYYVYAKVNGELIKDYYYDGVADGVYGNGTALSNKIIISAPAGNKFSAIPVPITYEDYDEIGYEDLRDAEGNALGNQTTMSGGTVFTYDQTSPTGSVILKYRWKIGTVPKFQLSFDRFADTTDMSYMFGAWMYAPGEEADAPNGRLWLRPSFGTPVVFSEAYTSGSSHNVEFARLKVKTGSNAGKYYVYLKIDDVLIAEDYVAADVVDSNGNYTSNNGKAYSISNEILFTFWGTEGNVITPYKELGSNEHEGTRGDLNNNGVLDAADLVILKKVLLGIQDVNEMPEGIADFDNNGKVDIIDYIAVIKEMAKSNDDTYAKSGSLTLGMQEHLLEDSTKTAAYIADASATLGATSYRLSEPIHNLFYTTSSNGAEVRADAMNEFKAMVAELKAKGINEILYVTDSFMLPYGYADPAKNHNITVPDPINDSENYIAWLNVNAAAFKALAQEVPEIKFFEPFNEINTTGTRFERYGIGWNATADEQKNYKFTVKEKAAIMADLCWYISDAVKSVDPANQVTTPSIVVGSNAVIEKDFIDELYKAIESGSYPSNKAVGDIRVDNYFTIVNLHAYPDYAEADGGWFGNSFEENATKEVNEWAGYINAAYDVVKAHNDGDSRVWITETGMSTCHTNGTYRDEQNVADIIGMALTKLDADLTFIDTVIFYKIADISSDNGASPSETNFGLFYSGDDMFDPYGAKPSAKAIYSYFHNGSTDYSALDALLGRYAY